MNDEPQKVKHVAQEQSNVISIETLKIIRERVIQDPVFRKRFRAQPIEALESIGIKLPIEDAQSMAKWSLAEFIAAVDWGKVSRPIAGLGGTFAETPEIPEMPEIPEYPEMPSPAGNALLPFVDVVVDVGTKPLTAVATDVVVDIGTSPAAGVFVAVGLTQESDIEEIDTAMRELTWAAEAAPIAIQNIQKITQDLQWAIKTLPQAMDTLQRVNRVAPRSLQTLRQVIQAANQAQAERTEPPATASGKEVKETPERKTRRRQNEKKE
jgi:hypothetical protein